MQQIKKTDILLGIAVLATVLYYVYGREQPQIACKTAIKTCEKGSSILTHRPDLFCDFSKSIAQLKNGMSACIYIGYER